MVPWEPMVISCGKCAGCARLKGNSWALRLMAEAESARLATVLTLTYGGDGTEADTDEPDSAPGSRRRGGACG